MYKKTLLSDAEIYTIAKNIAAQAGKWNKDTEIIVQTLFQTGCRIYEIFELERWSNEGNGTYSVSVEKSNETRYFDASILPPDFIKRVDAFPDGQFVVSVPQVCRWIKKHIPFAKIVNEKKEINSYIFRHAFARYLKMNGASDEHIQMQFAHTQIESTLNYIYDPLHAITFL